MAVTKTIRYNDSLGAARTTVLTIDVEKIAVGVDSDEEQVFLTVSAPGITSANYWRKNIDQMVEDAIFAASGSASTTRYAHASGTWSAYGDMLVNDGSGILNGVDGIEGMRQQLIDLAG